MGHRRWRILIGFSVACLAAAAGGQSLEGVLMPGKVIAGHAKYEEQCANCHVPFNKAAQDALCLGCHKDVARDVRSGGGYHGRLKAEPCRTCHTDHKGRDVNIVALDDNAFDHKKTDFSLTGAHSRATCRACHIVGKKYRDAPLACEGCHRKDDKHKGALGPKCGDCHGEATWTDARFDHDKTRFALRFKHADVACRDCHGKNTYKETPLACVACHRKDDKQHRGRLGEKCETCHTANDWREVGGFQHDRDTKYPLRGAHRVTKCESCHTSQRLHDRVPSTCVGCHRSDDKHSTTLGSSCGDCHAERKWREAKYDHYQSAFRLRGKHRDVDCKDCHRDATSYKGTEQSCLGCHRKDDRHKDRYGEKCADCHTEQSWREIAFRHDRDTKYPLAGKHAEIKCDGCHVGRLYRDKVSTDCYACHGKDDRHRGQLGHQCEQCHNAVDWKTTRFDHGKSPFPLLGRHARVECKACHTTAAYKDAKPACVECHRKEDKHKGALGVECASCHNARDWKIWDFDHARRTRFPLDGAHRSAACGACHKVPGEEAAALPIACVACHRGDDIHGGNFGIQCVRCHEAKSWRDARPVGRIGGGQPTESIVFELSRWPS